MDNSPDQRLAVLIDADNVPPSRIKAMLEEIAKYGTPTFKRIYGDWTSPSKSSWKSVLLPYAITPIQQYSYTTGKNASDSALIINLICVFEAADGILPVFCQIIGRESTPREISSWVIKCANFIFFKYIMLNHHF